MTALNTYRRRRRRLASVRYNSSSLTVCLWYVAMSLLLSSHSSALADASNVLDLTQRLASQTGATETDASSFVEAWQQSIRTLLKEQGQVALPGFGTFRVEPGTSVHAVESNTNGRSHDKHNSNCNGIDDACSVRCGDRSVGQHGSQGSAGDVFRSGTLSSIGSECIYECHSTPICADIIYDTPATTAVADDDRIMFRLDGESPVLRTFVDRYWTAVITEFARTLVVQSSNSPSPESTVVYFPASDMPAVDQVDTARDEPVFLGNTLPSNPLVVTATYMEIMAYWYQIVAGLQKKPASTTELTTRDMVAAAGKFCEMYLPSGQINPLRDDVLSYWSMALHGLDEFTGSASSSVATGVSVRDNDQSTILQLIQDRTERFNTNSDTDAELMETLHSIILNDLQHGDTVYIINFGSLSVTSDAARIGRNPRTGTVIQLPAATTVIDFRPARAMLDRVLV